MVGVTPTDRLRPWKEAEHSRRLRGAITAVSTGQTDNVGSQTFGYNGDNALVSITATMGSTAIPEKPVLKSQDQLVSPHTADGGESMEELHVGQPAPDFSVPAHTDVTVSLAGLKGTIAVLFFYPKDDTGG